VLELSNIFAIDIAGYAIMNNHYHIVVHIDQERAGQWTVQEICNRWHRLFSGNDLSRRFVKMQKLSVSEEKRLGEIVDEWRDRLINPGWFMRCLNEPIARDEKIERVRLD
jgi:hypothetical protein